jgi:anti-sigma regulatory factor (Ser/Thr protein kinase)
MIDDLFEVTSLEAGKLRIEPQCSSASDAIVYTVNTLQEAATAKGITLSSDVGCELPSIYADPARVQQILIILVDNAIKFTPANGTVKVQARIHEEDPTRLLLEVSDSGCGISPDMTERIFERLFQAADLIVAGRSGLGLGLYICKELVTRQGGQIWAKNAPGRGAVFSVTLPIFSLSNLIAPALRRNGHAEDPITLVVTEIGSRIGWLSEEVRAEISTPVRNLLERCLYSDLDVLLPKTSFAGAAELFFIVAITDALGGEAITKRIQKQLDSSKHIKQADLIISTSYQSLEPIERNASESMADFLEKVAAKIQERINQEISSRVVEHG